MIFWAVPKGHMPWRAVWPGAAFVTIAAGLANWLFPIYLANVSSLSRFGSTLGFILIALLWFYVLSLALMVGAVINSLRFEVHDTGELPYGPASCRRCETTAHGLTREEPRPGTATARGRNEIIELMQKRRVLKRCPSVLDPTAPIRPRRAVAAAADHRRDGRQLRREDLRGDDDRRHRQPAPASPARPSTNASPTSAPASTPPLDAVHRARSQAAARAAHAPADPPAEAVRKAVAAMLELMAAKPALAQLLTGDAIAVEPAVIDRYRACCMPAAGRPLGRRRRAARRRTSTPASPSAAPSC